MSKSIKFAKSLIIIASMVASNAMAQNGNTLKINVSNIQSEEGQILVSVCTKDEFMKTKCAYSALSKAVDAQIGPVIIQNIANGTYAVQLFHDLDSDFKLKTGAFGIPKEPWGMSNDAKGKFGPPKFEDAAIEINSSKEITINLDGGE